MRLVRSASLLVLLLALAAPASAHPGPGGGLGVGFLGGLAHPFGGLDHVLAMVAVGLWAAQLGGRALWLVPTGFVAAMLAGATLGWAGIGVIPAEAGILASVLLLGLLVAFAVRLPLALGLVVVGVFALCHGHAHGAAAATALLHGLGVAAGLAARDGRLLRWSGAGIAAAGLVLILAA